MQARIRKSPDNVTVTIRFPKRLLSHLRMIADTAEVKEGYRTTYGDLIRHATAEAYPVPVEAGRVLSSENKVFSPHGNTDV